MHSFSRNRQVPDLKILKKWPNQNEWRAFPSLESQSRPSNFFFFVENMSNFSSRFTISSIPKKLDSTSSIRMQQAVQTHIRSCSKTLRVGKMHFWSSLVQLPFGILKINLKLVFFYFENSSYRRRTFSHYYLSPSRAYYS